MAKSNASKKRKKLVRGGRRNPETSRSPFSQFDLRSRKTKMKKDYIYGTKHKNRLPREWENDSFLWNVS